MMLIPNELDKNINIKPITFNEINIYSFSSKYEFIEYIKNHNSVYIAINISKVYNPSDKMKNIINDSIGYADGFGAIVAMKILNKKSIKIPGCEIWLDIINNNRDVNKSYYLIGSTKENLKLTIEKLKQNFPKINIVGSIDGYSIHGKTDDLIKDIKSKQPDYIFVAIGSPNQEILMDKIYAEYPAKYFGLGGSFDIYSGSEKRASNFFIDNNLEWLYRWYKNPIKRTKPNIIFSFNFVKLLINYFIVKMKNRKNL
ncbi:WecB/TagA/CpsF family glycosyltransferase [Candidatus Neomarinimicrobiota bacterium]